MLFDMGPEQVNAIQYYLAVTPWKYQYWFFNWDLLQVRLNKLYKAWSYKKKKHKKIKAYRKSLKKKPTVKRHLLILDLKSFR